MIMLILLIYCCGFVLAKQEKINRSSILDVSSLLQDFQIGYDRRVRPNYGGPPISVKCSIYVLSVGEISYKFMDYTFDMYFRQNWVDKRLSFDANGVDKLVVGADYIKSIWVPDTFFVNEKVATFHKATQDNQFLRITKDGEILRSIRLTVKAGCPMDLALFPMDTQLCTLEIESYGYTMTDLVYFWQDDSSVEMNPDVSLAEFYVVGYKQRRVLEVLTSGNYSRLCMDIMFTRSMGYYLIQVYIPSSLIVVMSWVSFYLDRSSAPARTGLGVTTVLTMVTLMGSVNSSLPKISYMKALDIYLAVCFFMVFGALLEYATVSYAGKRIKLNLKNFEEFEKQLKKIRSKIVTPPIGLSDASFNVQHNDSCPVKLKQIQLRNSAILQGLEIESQKTAPPNTLYGWKPSDLEHWARFVFPLGFLTFHFFYWTILINISDVTVEGLMPLKKKVG